MIIAPKIHNDITELEAGLEDYIPTMYPVVEQYLDHLLNIKDDPNKLMAHIYVRHMGDLYGGQMIKTKVPGSGKMYDFENMQECVGSIRAIQNDEMAEEANKGFQYIINILDELQRNAG